MKQLIAAASMSVLALALPTTTAAFQQTFEYKVLATSKTSTMEKELNEAGDAGFKLQVIMGGETAIGGKEAVAVMTRGSGDKSRFQYKLLATNKTSTMQKEMQEAADAGFDYQGQTVFESLMGGKEVVVVMARDSEHPTRGDSYKLLATTKTSTMEKELQEAGGQGYVALGMTVSKTLVGGKELVTITRRRSTR